MAGLVAGATSGSLWGIGVLAADAASGREIPVVGQAEAGEVGMVHALPQGWNHPNYASSGRPHYRVIWMFRGNQAYAKGQVTEAELCYTHGIDSFSPNEASRKALMLCYSNRAATRMSLGKMREALSDCRKATDIDSSFLKAQKVSGFILRSKEYIIKKAFDKIPSALQMISDALSISKYSDNLMAMKAEALLLLQRYEEVIRFCEETLYLAERNSVCLCLGENSESNNLDNNTCSVTLWRHHFIAKSYFFLGKLEEAHQFLKKYEQMKVMECRCGKQSQESISSFSITISELLRLKQNLQECYMNVIRFLFAAFQAAGNEAFQSAAYQAMGQILDAIADCSLAIALDADYAKAGKFLVRSENISDAVWKEIINEIRRDADYLFKIIGNAYAMLSGPTMVSITEMSKFNSNPTGSDQFHHPPPMSPSPSLPMARLSATPGNGAHVPGAPPPP
ncbi:hypothetical protein BAE44_0006820 [Dichanthelium oligosanthes]|uniref:Uncharacterized protein n=1 Tax=Dichanthelium oligosanthes TaxID=888268 RepID=A0A1E5W4D7_9POAL|nr:hypothetical protein BAE44_0006820 [Dichanthelium oligosanthes]